MVELDGDDIDQQIYRQLRTARYLKETRLATNETLTSTAKKLGISHPYLSEIEKGIKVPSDQLIRAIAKLYNIDEDDLFHRYGKVPILAREELENRPILQKTLSEIKTNKKLTDEEKDELYDKMYKLYVNYIRGK